MVFLPQMSLIWHLVFMFFLPPPPQHSHFPKLLSLHFPIVLHLYTFTTFLFTPSLSPKCVPTPASLSSFSLFFILWLSPCYYHHLPLFDIQLHCFPPPSPWIAHPIPCLHLSPPIPHLCFFIILWTRSIIMV
jgi:hypothetical protein